MILACRLHPDGCYNPAAPDTERLAQAWWAVVNEPEEGPWEDASDEHKGDARSWAISLVAEYGAEPHDHGTHAFAEAIAAERARVRAAVEAMPTARIISQWDLVSRRAVLALLDDPT